MTSIPQSTEGEVAPPQFLPAPSAKPKGGKRRGKFSSGFRQQNFNSAQSNKYHVERRAKLDASLNPALALGLTAYMEQQQQGSSVARMVPVTTRGIGFHTAIFCSDAERNIPRIEQPPRATACQLYRYSLMQMSRHLVLAEPGPMHTLSPRVPVQPRVSAFSAHRNRVILADCISQLGNFVFDGIKHQTYIPTLTLSKMGKRFVKQPIYNAKSPAASPSKRSADTSTYVASLLDVEEDYLYTIPDPYCVTIHNLRDAVVLLSNTLCPEELRAEFFSRNPIPGAQIINNLLTNPDEVMPQHYYQYVRAQFDVTMDGRGSDLNLATVRTAPGEPFFIRGTVITCPSESHMYASNNLSHVSRIRSSVNLMTEMPLLPSRPSIDSSYGIRDPSMSVHTFVENWQNLAWNVSPFRRNM